MSVRKRTWVTQTGEPKEAWIVDYTDQNGERHIQTFARKKEAETTRPTLFGCPVRSADARANTESRN